MTHKVGHVRGTQHCPEPTAQTTLYSNVVLMLHVHSVSGPNPRFCHSLKWMASRSGPHTPLVHIIQYVCAHVGNACYSGSDRELAAPSLRMILLNQDDTQERTQLKPICGTASPIGVLLNDMVALCKVQTLSVAHTGTCKHKCGNSVSSSSGKRT